ncbi:MAG: RNA polymerase sigma factor [Candidatus Doudnabacteria bacterium]|nr:RNA polymerase sigma factor [Candidatus Doudnabacteria bacterium]
MMTEAEFLAAYERFSDAIFRHCFFRVYDREAARDLTQETFVRTWEYVAKGRDIDNIRAFLYRVANNAIIDYSRRKRALSLDELLEKGFDPAGAADPTRDIEANLDAREVMKVLLNLTSDAKDLVVMRYIDGFGPKEIAQIIGVSENVVSVRLNRAIKQLREYYDR